jgi:hypothetical protein
MTSVHQIPRCDLKDIWNAVLTAAENGTIYSLDNIDSLLSIHQYLFSADQLQISAPPCHQKDASRPKVLWLVVLLEDEGTSRQSRPRV